MARSTTRTRRQAGVLAIALGVGVLAFAFLGSEDPQEVPPADRARSITSAPSVLGVVVTPDNTPPTAGAASPATFDVPDRGSSTNRGTTATTVATTEAPPPTLIPPTEIENTTTTTERPTPTSIDLSTTTTDPSPTSTEEPTTTEPPAP